MNELRILDEFKVFLVRVFSICIITAVPATILLTLYFVTAPRIAEYHELKLKKSVLDIFKITYEIKDKQFLGFKYKKFDKVDLRRAFEDNITIEVLPSRYKPGQAGGESAENGRELFMYYKDAKLQGVGFVVTKLGYGFNKAAEISLFICVAPDLQTILGIEVLDQSETPGLGGRMAKDEFKKQFIGKKLRPKISIVRAMETVGTNEVHAITGASYTSKGVEDIINEAMQNFWREMKANRG